MYDIIIYIIVCVHAHFSGYWLFHCHLEFHAEIGMALIFKVGEHEEMPPVPNKFPECGDWKWTDNQDEYPVYSSQNNTISIMIEKEMHIKNDLLKNTTEQLLKLLPVLIEELKIPSSASALNVTSLLLAVCLLSSVFRIHS